MNRILSVDIDGTLTNNEYPYENATPRLDVIKMVNKHYDTGWHINLNTARGMNTFSYDVNACVKAYHDMTVEWLKKYGVKYHFLFFGKIPATFYLDDKNLLIEDFLEKQVF